MRKKDFIRIIILLVFLNLLSFAQDTAKIKEIIHSVQTKYVPDKRLGIFNIDFKYEKSGSPGNLLKLSGETDNKAALESLIEELRKNGANFENNIASLPDPGLKDKTFGIIKVSVANMRKKPDHDEEMVSQAILGTKVKLLKKKSGFYLAQTPENYLGWIESGSIASGNSEFIQDWDNAKKIVYTDIFGLVYTEPKEDSDPVMDIVIASALKYEVIENGWIKVKTLRGETGYIKEKSAMDFEQWKKTRNATPELLIKTGKRFLGFPYLWGGFSSKGLDCSGFVKTVYWLNGIMLPRDANQQGFAGEEVIPGKDFENVKTGDLVLFGSKGKEGKPKITHVGIYMSNQEFIHCAAYVQISSFKKDAVNYDPWHCETLVRIIRILK